MPGSHVGRILHYGQGGRIIIDEHLTEEGASPRASSNAKGGKEQEHETRCISGVGLCPLLGISDLCNPPVSNHGRSESGSLLQAVKLAGKALDFRDTRVFSRHDSRDQDPNGSGKNSYVGSANCQAGAAQGGSMHSDSVRC